MKRLAIAGVLAFAVLAAALLWWNSRKIAIPADRPLVLYGNVEIRQVDLAFGVDGPIAKVLVDEGDRVQAGQILAILDQDAFRLAEASGLSTLQAAEARLAELVAGSRPQEIERARALVASAESSLENALANLKRSEELVRTQAATPQALDAARMAHRTADAALRAARADLSLRVEGTREEQIAQQRAEVEAYRANLAQLRYRLDRSTLKAPNAGIVLTRIREPGAVVLANTPVLTISLIDPVWVRVYVDEPNLGRVEPGAPATVTTDSPQGKSYAGRIGFVSPTAEFTPKNVETPDLRTSLVYRVRVIVENPDGALRQGMPATVTLRPTPGKL